MSSVPYRFKGLNEEARKRVPERTIKKRELRIKKGRAFQPFLNS
jgi:hypothetical protein